MSSELLETERKLFQVAGQDFVIDKRFEIIKELGQGAYGLVASAKYTEIPNGGSVAIKKITNIFSKTVLCKRAIREIKLLKHFKGHKNITCLYDLDITDPYNFNEIYLYEELMDCDLHSIIKSGQPLTDAHYQSFIYQVLCGLKYIHSADVLHRDLKPGNLLVNADCELKICDFGLARGFSEDKDKNSGFMTEYVATRWYRAPEIMLSFQGYTKAIDVWSVGCILAELIGGTPLFKGKSYVDQLNQILKILGTPSGHTLQRIGSSRVVSYINLLPFMPTVPFKQLYPNANQNALDMLEKTLTLDASERITVDQALEHPYLEVWHDPQEEIVCESKIDFGFEVLDDFEGMKKLLIEEVVSFRRAAREVMVSDSPQPQYEQQQQQQQQYSDQMDIDHTLVVAGTDTLKVFSPTEFMALNSAIDSSNSEQQQNGYEEPPKPQENLFYSQDAMYVNYPNEDLLAGLEKELEFGLDGGFGIGQ